MKRIDNPRVELVLKTMAEEVNATGKPVTIVRLTELLPDMRKPTVYSRVDWLVRVGLVNKYDITGSKIGAMLTLDGWRYANTYLETNITEQGLAMPMGWENTEGLEEEDSVIVPQVTVGELSVSELKPIMDAEEKKMTAGELFEELKKYEIIKEIKLTRVCRGADQSRRIEIILFGEEE